MNHLHSAVFLAALISIMPLSASAEEGPMKGMDMPLKHHHKIKPKATLQPAEGASVRIMLPQKGQIVKGDQVRLQFELVKGKRGEHVHAYVDGELMGMFKGNEGSLTGLKPGTHTLELRVATADHNTELNATDTVQFTLK